MILNLHPLHPGVHCINRLVQIHLSSTKILPTTKTTRYGFHILWFLLYLVVFTQKASASESLILTAVFLRFFKKTGFEPATFVQTLKSGA